MIYYIFFCLHTRYVEFKKKAPSSLFLKLNIIKSTVKDRLELSVLSIVIGREKIISTFDLEFLNISKIPVFGWWKR